jgi:DNA-binding SARP family transcriptional activator/tetratricopeptide (TPR) repeat protein
MQSAIIRFTVLGAVRAWRGETELDLGPPQQRAVLALLLARGGHPTSLSELVDLLWATEPPPSAVNIVHRYVGTLRRVLEPELRSRAIGQWLVRHPSGYQATVDEQNLDLLRFRALAARAREAVTSGDDAVSLFTSALGLCVGPCAGDLVAVSGHPAFVAANQECLAVLLAAADAALAAGHAQQVLPALRQATCRDPLAEPLQARLMLVLAASGLQAEALAVYESTRAHLAEKLGIDPGQELRQAHARVLRQQTAGEPTSPRDHFGMARTAAPLMIRPAQLPADPAAFAGRRPEVARVLKLLAPSPHAPKTLPTVMIDGMPGAGKSALAIHCAHAVADRFPDGQLYMNLRGFDPGGRVSPAEALRSFLSALGMPPQRIPADLDGRAALYRSLLAGQRVLVVLDNARDAAHVRPLLPGSPTCAAIITSRHCLSEIVASDGARLVTLDIFSRADARESLAVRLGADRVAEEPEAVAELVELSGRLPLALALVAARAAARPKFPLAAIGGELREAQGSLDAFSEAGLPDVRAVFSWSYRLLSPPSASLFRQLSLHPGPDISLAAAASLHGAPPRQVRALLAELTWSRLVTEHQPGRYSMHDLLRAYATELCTQLDDAADREAAVSRVLDHCLHSAHNAYVPFRAPQRTDELGAPEPGVMPEQPEGYAAALGWYAAEQRVIEALIRYAVRHGRIAHAWQIASKMTLFYQRTGLWDDWETTARTALDAAEAHGDLAGEAHMHRILAGALFFLGDTAAALAELKRARDLYTRLGYSTEHAYLHSNFGAILFRLGRYEEAIGHHRQALALYRTAGLRIGEALAMDGIGSCANRLGDHDQAIESITGAMNIHRELDNPGGAAHSLAGLGESYHLLGDHDQAIEYTKRAVALYRSLGYRADEAEVLVALGDVRLAAGDVAEARSCFGDALAILNELRLPQADAVRDRLAGLDAPPVRPLAGLRGNVSNVTGE